MVYSVKFTLKTSLEKGKKNADTVKVGRLKNRSLKTKTRCSLAMKKK